MNPSHFITKADADAIVKALGDIGGGVDKLYIPPYWGIPTPEIGDAKFYHIRFKNGADGFNVGLIRQTMSFFPTRWPAMVDAEVRAVANSPKFPWEY